MENYNNPFEPKVDAPVVEEAVVETPVVETPVVEAPVVEAAPVVEEVTPQPQAEEAPKAEESSAIQTSDFGKSTAEVQAIGSVENGAIGTTTAPVKKAVAKKSSARPAKEDTVAIYSTRNVTWEGVGKVYRGYNIVSKEAADQWATRNHIRIATPEEVAKEFGK